MENKQKAGILDKLYSLHRFGIKPGLERTRHLLDRNDNPQLKFKSIHVAGTNGKGSVCSVIASVLKESGYKTGLYTSPHILDFNERIRINGVAISDDNLIRLAERYLALQEETEATFFEITTAMAFQYFADNNVDWAVIETGLGGRFDSTNVIQPELSVITQIDLEHREYLGDTLKSIAFEKAGIIKQSVPVVIGDNHIELKELFSQRAAELESPIYFADDLCKSTFGKIDKNLSMHLITRIGNNNSFEINSPLAGRHQIQNIETALLALDKVGIALDKDKVSDAFLHLSDNSGLIGRIDLVREDPPLIIDSAHNPAAIRIFCDTISLSPYSDTKWNILFGAMSDKDITQMLMLLKSICEHFIFTIPSSDRASNKETLNNAAREAGIDNFEIIESPQEALAKLLECGKPSVIIGSFYLLGDLLGTDQYQKIINKDGL